MNAGRTVAAYALLPGEAGVCVASVRLQPAASRPHALANEAEPAEPAPAHGEPWPASERDWAQVASSRQTP